MREVFERVVEKLSERASDGRELFYSEGAVGISSLLYCPIKWELRQKFPELKTDSLEIEDGFLFEREFKAVLREMFGDQFEEEKVLPLEVDGLKLEGHLDAFVELSDKVVGIELKHTKMTFVSERFPYRDLSEVPKVIFDENCSVYLPSHYLTQAGMQKFVLERLYPDKEVRQYLFVKTLLKVNGRHKKCYVVREVSAVSEEEFREAVRKFREERVPRYPWECSYCLYKETGLCPGAEWKGEEKTSLSEELKELLVRYQKLSEELREVKGLLKKEISGTVNWGGRTVGWVEKRRQRWDVPSLVEVLKEKGIPIEDFFSPDWRKYRQLERILKENGVNPDELRTFEMYKEFQI